jgi:hypothetical protein
MSCKVPLNVLMRCVIMRRDKENDRLRNLSSLFPRYGNNSTLINNHLAYKTWEKGRQLICLMGCIPHGKHRQTVDHDRKYQS